MKDQRKRFCLTVALFLCTAFLAVINTSHGALLSDMIGFYGPTDAQQGLPSSMQNLGIILSLLLSFVLIGRVPKKALLVGAFTGAVALMLPLSAVAPFLGYALLFVPIGIAFGFVDSLTSAMIADSYHGEQGTRMMCAMHAFHGLSAIFAPLILSAIASASVSWRTAYIAMLGAGLVMLAFVAPAVWRFSPMEPVDNARRKISAAELKNFFRAPGMIGLMFAMAFYGFYLNGMIVWVKRLADVGLQSGMGALALSLLYAGITASRLLMPLTRIKPAAAIRYGNLLAGLLLCAGVLLGNGPVLCACVALSSLLSGFMIPVTLSAACARYPQSTFLASVVTNLCMLLGQLFASPAIGALESVAGMRAGVLLCPVMLVCSGLSGLSIRSSKEKA